MGFENVQKLFFFNFLIYGPFSSQKVCLHWSSAGIGVCTPALRPSGVGVQGLAPQSWHSGPVEGWWGLWLAASRSAEQLALRPLGAPSPKGTTGPPRGGPGPGCSLAPQASQSVSPGSSSPCPAVGF